MMGSAGVAMETLLIVWLACIITWFTPTVTAAVSGAPHILDQPKKNETAYKLNEDVILPCVADNEAEYVWKKDGQQLDTDSGQSKYIIQSPGGSIIIKRPSAEDDGEYQCFASNEFGTAVTIKTQVRKAEIHSFATVHDPVVHRPTIGFSQTLRCNPPHSYPSPSVYWGYSQPRSTKLDAIDTNDRVLLDYSGNLHFANVIESDSALSLHEEMRYVCIAHNHLLGAYVQGDDQKMRPDDRDVPSYLSPSKMWTSPSPDVAIRGHNKKLKCIFAGLPTPRVEWKRVDGRWNDRIRVTPEGHGTEIEITNVDVEDEGTYRCTATNREGGPSDHADIRLVVHSVPFWHQNKAPDDKLVNEEDSVEFECQADGIPQPQVTWFFNGMAIELAESNDRRTVKDNRVVYSRVLSEHDNGVLQCIAANDHGSILANAALKVIAEPPSMSSAPEDQKVVEGQNVTLRCRVYGAPTPQLEWRHESTPVSGNRFTVHESGDLEIRDAHMSDNGTYLCNAVNKLGHDSADAFLIVRAPTRIFEGPTSQTVNAGDEVVLRCGAVTDPSEPLTVEWRHDGVPVNFETSSHLHFDEESHSLVIKSAAVTDTAAYTCHAGNGLDEVESPTATLTVRDRPSPPWSVRVECIGSLAHVYFHPGPSNNDPISAFVAYHRDWSPEAEPPPFNRSALIATRSRRTGDLSAAEEFEEQEFIYVPILPWRRYQFYVTAINELGESDLSESTSAAQCEAEAAAPSRNPDNVCSRLQAPKQLVIVWEPLSERELNGPGFNYVVKYKLLNSPGRPQTITIDDPNRSEVVIHDREIFRQYEISVQSSNDEGLCAERAVPRIGHSGEGKPMDPPTNFQLVGDPYNSTFAEFTWDSVDTSPERVQGFFRGYRILMWMSSDPNNQRTEDVILYDDFDTCPPISVQRRRRHGDIRRKRAGQPVYASTNQLWPFSQISATVATLNSANVGYQSDHIEFVTPEGLAGEVGSLTITERGSNHLVAKWTPPVDPNGQIRQYRVTCVVAPPNRGNPFHMFVPAAGPLTKMVRQLYSDTIYRISVSTQTGPGLGSEIFVDGTTLPADPPDKPLIDSIAVHGTTASVHFLSSDLSTPINPGTDFYVEYADESDADRGRWNETAAIVGAGSINVTGLHTGQPHTFRVVGMNGVADIVRKTRSDPHTVEGEGVVTYATPAIIDPTAAGLADDDYVVRASAGWFITLMIIIAILLLILLIACIIHRSRGDMYPVYEKEKLRGRDPLAPDDAPFGEYTAGGRPDIGRSTGSLDSEEKPLESSESDSLGEYEDPEVSKFNEDGSFIGLYGGQKKPPPPAAGYNTFV